MKVVIVGAGAAGIAAAKHFSENKISFLLIEAGHRLGGRAFTETLADGAPFDLGCHWLHSASLNPFVAVADRLGIHYEKREGYGPLCLFSNSEQLSMEKVASLNESLASDDYRMRTIWAQGSDVSVFEALDKDRPWGVVANYWTALETSSDVDQVSIGDLINYDDTDENWPVIDGYGTLVNQWATDVPVKYNTGLQEVHWGESGIRLVTTQGDIRTDRVILTVSTGVLGSGDIRFFPELPERKQAAIAALPLGNYNRIRLSVEPDTFDSDVPERILVLSKEESPMSLSIRPYGFDCVIGLVGGRYADWLERSGPSTSATVVRDQLSSVFGNDIVRQINGDRQSAWRGDPLTQGAYSSALPGEFHQRGRLAESLDEKLYFAGEATSTQHFCTCHGAMMTGKRAATEVIKTLSN